MIKYSSSNPDPKWFPANFSAYQIVIRHILYFFNHKISAFKKLIDDSQSCQLNGSIRFLVVGI